MSELDDVGWPRATIREIAPEGIAGGPFGSSLGRKDYEPGGVPVIRGSNLRDADGFRSDRLVFVSEAKADELARNLAVPGDIVLTQRGTLGQVALVPQGRYRRYVVSQSQMRVRPNPQVADNYFVFLAMRSPEFTAQIERHAIATGVPHINLGILENLSIPLPPLPVQLMIAALVRALDNKIGSNRRILELVWDFASAWWAELGQRCARRASLGDLVDINPEKVSPGSPDNALTYVDIAAVSPRRIDYSNRLTWAEAPSRARRKARDGDVIFSAVRPNRRSFGLVLGAPADLVVSTGFALLRPRRLETSALAAIADSHEFAAYLAAVAEGSAYPAVSPEQLAQFEVSVPASGDLERFEQLTMPLRRRAVQAEREAAVLLRLRSALLPELLSGRLRVREAEDLVGGVT